MKQKNYSKGIFYLLLFICIIASGLVLKFTAKVVVPVMFAVMLSLVMLPLLRKLNKKFHIPWIVSAIFILIISTFVIVIVGNLLISSLKTIILLYPRYENRFTAIYQIFAQTFKLPFNETSSLFENLWNQLGVRNAVQGFALTFSSNFISFTKTLMMIMLLILFLVSEMHYTKEKLNAAFPVQKINGRIAHALNNIILDITRFVSIKFIISLLTGLLVGIGTQLLGLDFPIVWGFIAFVLNFIPTFGSIFSGVITILFSIIQFYPDIKIAVLTTILMLGVNMTLGNIIEPKIEGKNLGLSPFFILVSLSIWGGIWGFSGMLLAVPVTVILKIICENISFLHPVAILLGNHPKETQLELSPLDDDDESEDEAQPQELNK